MLGSFDPYYHWLGIPPKDQPPNRYRLLGLELFEANPSVIENAADQRMAHVRTFQLGSHADWSQKILNELAAAKVCLLNPEKKAAYDRELHHELTLQRAPGVWGGDGPMPASVPVVPLPVAQPLPAARLLPEADSLPRAVMPEPPIPTIQPVPVVLSQDRRVSDRIARRHNASWQVALSLVAAAAMLGAIVFLARTDRSAPGRIATVNGRQPVTASNATDEKDPSGGEEARKGQTGNGPDDPPPSIGNRRLRRRVLTVDASSRLPQIGKPSKESAEREQELVIPPPLVEKREPPATSSGKGSAITDLDEAAIRERLKMARVLGLKWLARHQHPDGSWSFQSGPERGNFQNIMGATALAMMPLMSFGSTHKKGEYSENVRKGVEFLGRRAQFGPNGADLRGTPDHMYVQALATTVLCQLYHESKDPKLRSPAQLAVNFIVYSQDPKRGGWRYQPRQRGDTSSLAWQMTALVSAREAKLKVPQTTFAGAAMFLDSVQSENGREYGYEGPGRGSPTTTAIGLLCRTCLGWERDHPALGDGVNSIVVRGPADDMYYNLYATRLLRIWGGAEWEGWKKQIGMQILTSQARIGETEGSWFVGRSLLNEAAGRLGVTSITLLVLAAVESD
jgi:hypothetical protein